MENMGVRPDQNSQVRGFADQRLRLADKPEDPSNRRISLIVQYQVLNGTEVAPGLDFSKVVDPGPKPGDAAAKPSDAAPKLSDPGAKPADSAPKSQ